MKPSKSDKLRIIAELHKGFNRIIGTELISVADQNSMIEVEISGFAIKFLVDGLPKNFIGVGKFVIQNERVARFIRAADEIEKMKYMTQFPSVRMIVVKVKENSCLSVQENLSHRVVIDGLVEVKFVGEFIEPFMTILTRFDGANLMYESWALSSNKIMEYLKESLTQERTDLDRYIPPRHELAYRFAMGDIIKRKEHKAQEEKRRQLATTEGKLRHSIEHLGGEFQSYQEVENQFLVTYRVDGRQFNSRVRKDNLRTVASGICLSGRDGDFDLTTLVGVMRKSIGEDIDDSDW